MPIQYADKPKQPGETLRYSMTFSPGKAIATGDSLTGTPTVTVATYPGGEDASATMIRRDLYPLRATRSLIRGHQGGQWTGRSRRSRLSATRERGKGH